MIFVSILRFMALTGPLILSNSLQALIRMLTDKHFSALVRGIACLSALYQDDGTSFCLVTKR